MPEDICLLLSPVEQSESWVTVSTHEESLLCAFLFTGFILTVETHPVGFKVEKMSPNLPLTSCLGLGIHAEIEMGSSRDATNGKSTPSPQNVRACVRARVICADGVAAAAVGLRGSLKAALRGGPSVLTGGSSPIAASCLNGGGGVLAQSAHRAADKIK